MVTCLDETGHNLQDGDYVTFTEVQGMTELNHCEPRQVKVLGEFSGVISCSVVDIWIPFACTLGPFFGFLAPISFHF